MKAKLLSALRILGLLILAAVLAYVIWQPVLPSGLIIQQMAERIEPGGLSQERPSIVRFDLSGKGGGLYEIVVSGDKVEVVEDGNGPADLILFMEARDFNSLMFDLAMGKVDESVFMHQILSKKMRFAGNMELMKTLFSPPGA